MIDQVKKQGMLTEPFCQLVAQSELQRRYGKVRLIMLLPLRGTVTITLAVIFWVAHVTLMELPLLFKSFGIGSEQDDS
jgi:hypothetical protein